MFDDKPQPLDLQAPPDLPIDGGNDNSADASAEFAPPPPPDASGPTSALDAGILTRKEDPQPINTPPSSAPSDSPVNYGTPPAESYKMKEPFFGKMIMILGIVAFFAALIGGGGWFFYDRFIKTNTAPTAPTEETPSLEDNTFTMPSDETTEPSATIPTTPEAVDENILFGGSAADSDGDGIDDNKEMEIGTDPNSWDTDKDELGDGEEYFSWKTNPLNPDTDSDTYLDGQEIKNNYNPLGPGKLLVPPVDFPGTEIK